MTAATDHDARPQNGQRTEARPFPELPKQWQNNGDDITANPEPDGAGK